MPVQTQLLNAPSPSSLADSAGIARMQAETGSYLELATLLGLRPDLYDAIGKGYDAFFRNPASELSEEERELSALLTALLCHSPYPARLHRARIQQLNVSAAVLEAVETFELNSQDLSHRQRAYLNFVRKVAAFPHTIVDKDILYLEQNGFTQSAMLELASLASYVTMLGRLSDALNVGL